MAGQVHSGLRGKFRETSGQESNGIPMQRELMNDRKHAA